MNKKLIIAALEELSKAKTSSMERSQTKTRIHQLEKRISEIDEIDDLILKLKRKQFIIAL